MYKQEVSNRETINEKIKNIREKMSNKSEISEAELKRIAKKVLDVKNWTKGQLSDVIESVEIDNEDNIFINYKYDILELA